MPTTGETNNDFHVYKATKEGKTKNLTQFKGGKKHVLQKGKRKQAPRHVFFCNFPQKMLEKWTKMFTLRE